MATPSMETATPITSRILMRGDPVFGVVEHMRAYDTAADVAGDVVCVFHGPVIGAPQFQDAARYLVLGTERQDGQCEGKQKGEEWMFH